MAENISNEEIEKIADMYVDIKNLREEFDLLIKECNENN